MRRPMKNWGILSRSLKRPKFFDFLRLHWLTNQGPPTKRNFWPQAHTPPPDVYKNNPTKQRKTQRVSKCHVYRPTSIYPTRYPMFSPKWLVDNVHVLRIGDLGNVNGFISDLTTSKHERRRSKGWDLIQKRLGFDWSKQLKLLVDSRVFLFESLYIYI